MRVALSAVVAGILLTSSAQAQEIHYWSSPASSAGLKFFPSGTPIMLRTRTQISTRDNKPGDTIYFEVAEAVTYQGQVVLPIGSQAVGEVARADRNGHFGRKGQLDVRLLYVDAPMGRVRLDGESHRDGRSGAALSFATIALVSPLGFLIHGTSATIPFGTAVQAYTAEPLRFLPQATQASVAAVLPDSQTNGYGSGASAPRR